MNNVQNVVVVGGGLVGSLCALFMAQKGYRVDLYEYREDPRKVEFSRGRSINLALSNRARRALRKVGLEEEVLECGIPMKGRLIHELSGGNKSILYDPTTKQCIHSMPRNFLNQKLLDEAGKYSNVTLHFKHKLVHVDLDGSCLTFLEMQSNTKVDVHGDVLIGADGAFSTMRRAMQQTPLFNFSQTYIDHGYIEMCIPPGKSMIPNHLHIWPRGEFMMIALPNQDDTWTVTLFMPFSRFRELDAKEKLLQFFGKTFPDSLELIGEDNLLGFFQVQPSTLLTIKCNRFHFKNVVLVGDAAHAMVPFYGQGMNAGFEDCLILDSILEKEGEIEDLLELFSKKRCYNAHSICDLALYNYMEMRDLVTRPSYKIRKTFDDFLFWLMPNLWIPLYNSVTFSKMNYGECINNRKWQNKILMGVASVITVCIVPLISFFIYRSI